MTQLTINNQAIQVQPGRTILEACREHGIPIPTLCYHPALKPYGACRLCTVEITLPQRPLRLASACTYPCEEGLVVKTDTPAVLRSRRIMAELLLAGSPESPELLALAEELGVGEVRYRLPQQEQCILCGLCVRACEEIVGVSAISFAQRGIHKQVSPPFKIAASACIACGTCVLICPTSAIHLRDVSGPRASLAVHGALHGDAAPLYCRACADSDLSVQYFEDWPLLASPRAK
jgi:NADH dehydrogenase/NADH:ubiquinone oxidoreductase subunit G